MKHTLWVALLLALCLTLALPAAAQDDEDDPARLDITLLEDGVPVEDAFENEFAARLYAFGASAGDVVTISMDPAGNSPIDPYLVLLGEEGEVYFSDDDGGRAPAARIDRFPIREDGAYLVLATTFQGRRIQDNEIEAGEPLEYRLVAEGFTSPNPDREDPRPIQVFDAEIGDAFDIEISVELPVAYVTFLADEGDVVSISAISNDLDTLLYLFDREGNRIALNDDRAEDRSSLIPDFELPEDGVYLVFVTAYDFDWSYLEDWLNFGDVRFAIQ
jgi:hypothetical protein